MVLTRKLQKTIVHSCFDVFFVAEGTDGFCEFWPWFLLPPGKEQSAPCVTEIVKLWESARGFRNRMFEQLPFLNKHGEMMQSWVLHDRGGKSVLQWLLNVLSGRSQDVGTGTIVLTPGKDESSGNMCCDTWSLCYQALQASFYSAKQSMHTFILIIAIECVFVASTGPDARRFR